MTFKEHLNLYSTPENEVGDQWSVQDSAIIVQNTLVVTAAAEL